MKIKLTKIACYTLVAAVLALTPSFSHAADESTDAAAGQAAAPKKAHGLPFHGKVATVDTNAMTFTVGKLDLQISSKTKISKDGKPGVFADITVGEMVAGSYKKGEDGKLTASSVKIGEKKKKKSEDSEKKKKTEDAAAQ